MSEYYSEIELELTPETNTKSYNISVLVMLTSIIFCFSMVEVVIPLPIGMFMVYIFRGFGNKAIQALLLSNVILFIDVILFFNTVFILDWLITSATDVVQAYIVKRGNFSFTNNDIFNMGAVATLLFNVLTLPMLVSMMLKNGFLIYSILPVVIVVSLFLLIVMAIIGGIAYMFAFRGVKKVMKSLFNIDEIKMV